MQMRRFDRPCTENKEEYRAHVFCLCSGIQMGNLTLPLLFAKILVEGVVTLASSDHV